MVFTLKILNNYIFLKSFDPFTDFDSEPVLIGTAVIEPKCILHRVI